MLNIKTNIAIVLTSLFLLSQPTVAEELRIGTATQGGAFYPVGQAVSTLVTNHAEGLEMVPVVTQGSVQNPKLVNSGEIYVGITNNNLAVLANKGMGAYKKSGAMELRAIGPLHFSVLHMITGADSDIKTVADLKGKKLALGPAGGGTIPFVKQILGLHDLTLKDITPSFLSYADGFSQLSDGNVDAVFALSGYPASAVVQARVNKELKFIKFAPGVLAKALIEYPNYSEIVITKDVYDMQADGSALGVSNILFVRADLDEEKAYKITKAIYSNMDEFKQMNASAKQIIVENAKKLKIPLHPGAERYFNE